MLWNLKKMKKNYLVRVKNQKQLRQVVILKMKMSLPVMKLLLASYFKVATSKMIMRTMRKKMRRVVMMIGIRPKTTQNGKKEIKRTKRKRTQRKTIQKNRMRV